MAAHRGGRGSGLPRAWIFNYTNPVNIVAQALSSGTDVPIVSLCEGPIVFQILARAADLDPDDVESVMVGLNHACWSVSEGYRGGDPHVPCARRLRAQARSSPTRRSRFSTALDRRPHRRDPGRLLPLLLPFEDEILAELQAKPTTRAEDILAEVPGYWEHYQEQAAAATSPVLDGALARRPSPSSSSPST